jgi:4'-phosphopantetheinyl transferase
MTKVYFAVLNEEFERFQIAPFLALFQPDEQERILRYKKPADAKRTVLGRLLLLAGLKDFGVWLKDLRCLCYSEKRKPQLSGLDNISFSVSHSGEVVALVLSDDSKVGIDIEETKGFDLEDFEHYVSMIGAWEVWESDRSAENFYRIWTKSEAALKAHGTGFLIDPSKLELADGLAGVDGTCWYLKELFLWPNFICHIASSVAGGEADITRKYKADLIGGRL